MCFVTTRKCTIISYFLSEPLTFPVVNVISFSPVDQQLLRFSPLLDYVIEMTCHLFSSVQLDFDEGNFRSGLTELLPSFAIAT